MKTLDIAALTRQQLEPFAGAGVGVSRLDAESAAHVEWSSWTDLVSPSQAARTFRRHALAIGTDDHRLAVTSVVAAVAAAFVELNVAALTLLERVLASPVGSWQVGVLEDGRITRQLRLGASKASVLRGDPLAANPQVGEVASQAALGVTCHTSILEAVDALVTTLPDERSVLRRVIDTNIVMTWFAVLRRYATHLADEHPLDLLEHHWHSRPNDLAAATRTLSLTTPSGHVIPFLVRRVCCLDYRLGRGHRHYCGTCPLIPDATLLARRQALLRGERPGPLTDDQRGASRAAPRPPDTEPVRGEARWI